MAKKLTQLSTRTPVNTDYTYLMSNNGTVEGKQQLINITALPVQGNITVNLNSSMTASEIQDEIDAVDRFVPYGSSVTFQFANGTYNLNNTLFFQGFYGGGYLQIQGDTSQTAGLHTNHNVHLNFNNSTHGINCVHNRMAIIFVQHLKVTAEDGYSCVFLQRMGLYHFRYNYCINTAKTSNSSQGLNVTTSAVAEVNDNYFSNNHYAIFSRVTATVFSSNNDETGTQPNYGLRASENGIIGKSGTQPSGSTANESFSLGGEIR